MDIGKIHADYRNTILKYEQEIEMWKSKYRLANSRAANYCNNSKIKAGMYEKELEKNDVLLAQNMVFMKRIVELQARLDSQRVDDLLSNPSFVDSLRSL